MDTKIYLFLTMVLAASVSAVEVEFYWTTVEKLPTDDIQTALYNLLNRTCFSSNSTKSECGVDVSSDLLDKSSISITDPTQDKFNVEVTIAATYVVSNTNRSLTNSQLLAFLKKLTVRKTLKEEVGLWMEKVGGDRFHHPADEQNNIVISLIFLFLTLIILIITLALMKLENNAKEEERKAKLKASKRSKENQSYKVRPGPSPIDRWPSMRNKLTKEEEPIDRPKTAATNGHVIPAQHSPQEANQHYLESPASLSNDHSTVSIGTDNLTIKNDTELSYVMAEQVAAPKLPPLEETGFTDKKKKKKSKKKKKDFDEESTNTREENERSEVRHDIGGSDIINQGYIDGI